jgi:hypothetical protein
MVYIQLIESLPPSDEAVVDQAMIDRFYAQIKQKKIVGFYFYWDVHGTSYPAAYRGAHLTVLYRNVVVIDADSNESSWYFEDTLGGEFQIIVSSYYDWDASGYMQALVYNNSSLLYSNGAAVGPSAQYSIFAPSAWYVNSGDVVNIQVNAWADVP